MSPIRPRFDPVTAAALAKLVRRAQRGLNRRRAAEREVEAATWRERLVDVQALLNQIESGVRPNRPYIVGAAQVVLAVALLDDPHDRREARAKQRALDTAERRFADLVGECLACVAEDRWVGAR